MGDEGYSGWKNYETWAVVLWLNNDEGSQAWAREVAAAAGDPYEGRKALEDMVEELIFGDEAPASLASDLFTHALGRVDWQEVYEAFIEE